MGNTCASIHIAWRGAADDASKAISRSYSKLGYKRGKKAPAEGGKLDARADAGAVHAKVHALCAAQEREGRISQTANAVRSRRVRTLAGAQRRWNIRLVVAVVGAGSDDSSACSVRNIWIISI